MNDTFCLFSLWILGLNDYRLKADSPARAAGIVLPAELEDPFRPKAGRPDIGAIPLGERPWSFGRDPRRVPGQD